jgi:hypothetical protein
MRWLVICALAGCATITPVDDGDCVQLRPRPARKGGTVPWPYKHGQFMTYEEALADDPRAPPLLRQATREESAAIALLPLGFLATVPGFFFSAEEGKRSVPLALGPSLLAVGVTELVVGAILLPHSDRLRMRALNQYNERTDCP